MGIKIERSCALYLGTAISKKYRVQKLQQKTKTCKCCITFIRFFFLASDPPKFHGIFYEYSGCEEMLQNVNKSKHLRACQNQKLPVLFFKLFWVILKTFNIFLESPSSEICISRSLVNLLGSQQTT